MVGNGPSPSGTASHPWIVAPSVDGKLTDLGKQEECPARELVRELVAWFIDDVVDDLGSRKEVEYAFRILDEGSSADRQLATYQRTGDLKAVVDQLIVETREGVFEPREQRAQAGDSARAAAPAGAAPGPPM